MMYTSISCKISRLGQLDSKTRDEFSKLGIENSSLGIIADMVSPEDSENVFEILLKISRSHKSIFHIKSGMTGYWNPEDNVIFDIDESVKRMGSNSSKVGKSLNDLLGDDDFQQRKEMRDALRD